MLDENEVLKKLEPHYADRKYLKQHLKRLTKSINIIERLIQECRHKRPRILDLGSYAINEILLKDRHEIDYYSHNYWKRSWLRFWERKTKILKVKKNQKETVMKLKLFNANLETEKLPFRDNFFDIVICTELIEHLNKDPMNMLSEVNRVLKENGEGKLFLTTPNICSIQSFKAILNNFPPYIYPKFMKDGNDRHAREYCPKDLKLLLSFGGFAINQLFTENMYFGEERETDDLLKKLGAPRDNRGDTIFCTAKKEGPVKQRYPDEFYD